MFSWNSILLVGAGGMIGSVLRYLAGLWIRSVHFPWATAAVNLTGSFLIGLLLAWGLKPEQLPVSWKLFLVTGLCGGFTTFSTFSWENLQLLQQERYLLFFGYLALSLVGGLAATWLGWNLAR